jgi:hypothetical protein
MPQVGHGVFRTTPDALGLRGDFEVLDFNFGHLNGLLIQRFKIITPLAAKPSGEFRLQQSTFFAPGAPRAFSIGTRLRF